MLQLLEPHSTESTCNEEIIKNIIPYPTTQYVYKTDRDVVLDIHNDDTLAENIIGPLSPHYTQPYLSFGPFGTLFYNDTVNRSIRSVLLSDNRANFDDIPNHAVQGIHLVDEYYSIHYSSSNIPIHHHKPIHTNNTQHRLIVPSTNNNNKNKNTALHHQSLHHPSVDFDTVLHILRSEHILITELVCGVNLNLVLKTLMRSLPSPNLSHTKLDRLYMYVL